MIYVDGSVLSRVAGPNPETPAVQQWVRMLTEPLCTANITATEINEEIVGYGFAERMAVLRLYDRIHHVAMTEDAMMRSIEVASVLDAFGAIHLGAARDQRVSAIATFNGRLAQVAHLYEIAVVSPGWPDRWYIT